MSLETLKVAVVDTGGWGEQHARIFSRRAATAIVAALVLGAGCGSEPSAPNSAARRTFRNPIKDIGNDPWVAREGDYYYLTESWNGGIWITRSTRNNLTDLAWSGESVKVWSYPTSGPNCAAIWAPELHRIGDRWFIYYAATTCDDNNDNHRMFVLESTSDDPVGSYTDRGKISDRSDHWAIDGTRFEHDGEAYFVWSGWPGHEDGVQNLYIAAMPTPTTLSGTRVLLSEPTYDWEQSTMGVNEGPEALTHGETVHLVYSASASWTDAYCYGLLTLTGDDPLDPTAWQKSPEPVFSSTDTVFGPGHGSFVTSPDGTENWMIYHSARTSGSGWDRVMNAQRFTWNGDVPDFGRPVSPDVDQPVPSGQVR